MEKNESKYFYTAMLMNHALISMLEKKDIEFITVTEITKKAGVNRSTFYLHYENIYELLEETIKNLNDKFISSFGDKLPLKITSTKDAFLMTNDFLLPYLNFCKENKKILQLINKNFFTLCIISPCSYFNITFSVCSIINFAIFSKLNAVF